jgi:hypothetical protein
MSRYADYVVFKIPITNKEYRRIGRFLKQLNGRYLIYDYIGAALSPFGISTHFKHHYICSTFVTRILSYVDSIELDKDLYKFSPMDVNNFFNQTKFKNNEKTKGEQ